MNSEHKKIWKLALPYLKKGITKDMVIHTEGVVKAMEMILKKESADENIMIIAAILHDVGWSKVPKILQKKSSWINKLNLRKAMELHLEYAKPIIREILGKLNYENKDIEQVEAIVKDHKYKNPRNKEKRLLIDADNLSDVYKEQFWTDIKKYDVIPKEQYEFRKKNKFYTKTAQEIFNRELSERKKEINFKL